MLPCRGLPFHEARSRSRACAQRTRCLVVAPRSRPSRWPLSETSARDRPRQPLGRAPNVPALSSGRIRKPTGSGGERETATCRRLFNGLLGGAYGETRLTADGTRSNFRDRSAIAGSMTPAIASTSACFASAASGESGWDASDSTSFQRANQGSATSRRQAAASVAQRSIESSSHCS